MLHQGNAQIKLGIHQPRRQITTTRVFVIQNRVTCNLLIRICSLLIANSIYYRVQTFFLS